MSFKNAYKEAFVWIWLPEQTMPVVAGRLQADNGNLLFNYGKSYLERIHDEVPAIPIYEGELPLKPGILPLPNGRNMPGYLRDAAPDAWGRRVIINRKLGKKSSGIDTAEFDELTYLLESGSDRPGALDFQLSPTIYEPRLSATVPLEELLHSAERVEKGLPPRPALDEALFHGSSIGGARPKALIEDGDKKYIAKFFSSTDLYNVVKAEFIAMRLAELAGLDVAPVKLTTASGKDVLLVERFDRKKVESGWQRKAMVSALTLLGLNEMLARYASYETFAEIIRHKFADPTATLRELFSRLIFNILSGNTDDHARNHAAFWDGKTLTLTPAYDICPQGRAGNEASQAMLIRDDQRLSRIEICLEAAHNFLLTKDEATAVFEKQRNVIETHWEKVCQEARLNETDRKLMWRRQFLNPFAFEGLTG